MPLPPAHRTEAYRFTVIATPITMHEIECGNVRGTFDVSAKLTPGNRQISSGIGELFVGLDFECAGTQPNIVVIVV